MTEMTEPIAPLHFLSLLREANPQFAEIARGGGGYAQQDAGECWIQILNSMRHAGLGREQGGWTDRYMTSEMETTYVVSPST